MGKKARLAARVAELESVIQEQRVTIATLQGAVYANTSGEKRRTEDRLLKERIRKETLCGVTGHQFGPVSSTSAGTYKTCSLCGFADYDVKFYELPLFTIRIDGEV